MRWCLTLRKERRSLSQLSRMRRATREPVNLRWRWIMDLSTRTSSACSTGMRSSDTSLQAASKQAAGG